MSYSGSSVTDTSWTRPRRSDDERSCSWTAAKWRSISGQKLGSGQRVYTNVTASTWPRQSLSERRVPRLIDQLAVAHRFARGQADPSRVRRWPLVRQRRDTRRE